MRNECKDDTVRGEAKCIEVGEVDNDENSGVALVRKERKSLMSKGSNRGGVTYGGGGVVYSIEGRNYVRQV